MNRTHQVFALVVVLGLVLSLETFAKPNCSKRNAQSALRARYKLCIVGGGFSGTSASYLVYLTERLNQETKSGLHTLNMSDVLLLEGQSQLGGDAKSKLATDIDPNYRQLVNDLYGYDGPWYYDLGPQRVPQLTTRLQRSLAVDAQSIQQFTPYLTDEYTRGKIVRCPTPNFRDYCPANPYGMPSTCTDAFPFAGNTSNTWDENGYDLTQLGPGYNYTYFQDWAYKMGPLTAMNNYILFGGPNPKDCPEFLSCEDCGDCFATNSTGYLNLKAMLLAKFGTEGTAAYIQDYGGFYADFEQGLFNGSIWGKDFWPREFDTNLLYGYSVGSMQVGYIYKLATPVLDFGTVITNAYVTDISSNDEGTVTITTNDCEEYTCDFLIYAGQPETIFNGSVTGDYAAKIRASPIFQSVYSVPVETVDVTLFNMSYLINLMPANVTTPTVLTRPWGDLKGNGPDTMSPRTEFTLNPYSGATKNFRPIVSDFQSLDALKDVLTARQNGNHQVAQQLWEAIRVDQAYIHQIDISEIPEKFNTLNINRLETGYYYVWANTTTSAQQLVKFARAPLGNNVPICLAHESWNPRYLGWGEAGMRAGQRCIDRVIPGSSDLIECWLYVMFPPCNTSTDDFTCPAVPDNSVCFSDPANDILGTETIIPSRFCSERWYMNDYVKTPGCIKRVKLTPTTCASIAGKQKEIMNQASKYGSAARTKNPKLHMANINIGKKDFFNIKVQ